MNDFFSYGQDRFLLFRMTLHFAHVCNCACCVFVLSEINVAQWLVRRNSTPKTMGFEPVVGQGEGKFVYSSGSTLVHTCLSLNPPYIPPTPLLRVYGTHLNCVRTLKILYPSVVKE